ncbi:MAG: division/cell wall cluster transcriptional repressor MraZ [Anaerolineae bacterium]
MYKFHGESDHSLDDKGRVIIPAKYRDALVDGYFLTRGLDGCLWLFPLDAWEQISSSRAERSKLTLRGSRNLDRLLYSGTEGKIDGQGRMLIPQPLREHAGLSGKSAVVVGVMDRLEIWSPERWAAITELLADEEAEFAEQLSELGL